MTRPDYCPISNAPCQSMCTTSCKARKPLTPAQRRALIDRAGDITDGLNQDDFADEIVKLVEQHHGISAVAQPSPEPSKPEQAEGGEFTKAWLNLDRLPGTMMQGPGGLFGPVPASTSTWVTTSERERDRLIAQGKNMLTVYTTSPTLPPASAAGEREASEVGQLEYMGNSVAFIHQKMTAYRGAIDAAWEALRAAGIQSDGKTTVAQAIAALATKPQAETVLIDFEAAHRIAFQAARAFRPPYYGDNFRAHTWVVEAVRSAHMDGQRHARGLPPIDRGGEMRERPVAPAVQADNSELCKTLMQIARNDGAPSWSQRFALGQAIGLLSATPPAPTQQWSAYMADKRAATDAHDAQAAQPSPEPSKPEQAEAPGDSDPLTPEQEEWVMDLAEKHNLGRRVSQIGTMRGVAPDVFYTDASYRTGELFSFAAELLTWKAGDGNV